MQWRNEITRYGGISRMLHWVMALFIALMLLIGWTIESVPLKALPLLMTVHKSLGLVILALVAVRLLWRFYSLPPRLPAFVSKPERVGATLIQSLMYGLMFAMPLSGWAMGSASGRPVLFLGRFALPPLVAPDKALSGTLFKAHGLMAYGLAACIALHVSGVVYHALRKEPIFARMWPKRR